MVDPAQVADGTDNGAPGARRCYGADYYVVNVVDRAGHGLVVVHKSW